MDRILAAMAAVVLLAVGAHGAQAQDAGLSFFITSAGPRRFDPGHPLSH